MNKHFKLPSLWCSDPINMPVSVHRQWCVGPVLTLYVK